MGREPRLDDSLGALRSPLARRRSGEVAQPGEAVQTVGEVPRHVARAGEVDAIDGDPVAAVEERAGQQRLARGLVPGHRILGHRDELERCTPPDRRQRETAQAPGEALEEGRTAFVAGADQLPPRVDRRLVARADLLEQAHPRSFAMLAL